MSRDLIALVLAVITVACVGSARAQYAPDGNAHPETKLVDEVEGDVTGVFGTPPARSAALRSQPMPNSSAFAM